MRPSPPGSGTLFITQPQAKKKPSPSAQESGAQQNLLVHTRASPHRQAHASVLTVAATLECCYRLIDGKDTSSTLVPTGIARYYLSYAWLGFWEPSITVAASNPPPC